MDTERQRLTTRGFPNYDDYSQIREVGLNEEKRPWNYIDVLASLTPRGAKILDCGCGNTFKLEELLQRTGSDIEIFAYDINEALLNKAYERIAKLNLPIEIFRADMLSDFPVPSESFDVVTFMLAKHNAEEAHRVLKPGGLVVLETVAERDKREAKELFGADKNGVPRGFLCEYAPGELYSKYNRDFIEAGFEIESSQEGIWTTYYTKEGLLKLLNSTPFVRDFDEKKDENVFKEVVRRFSTPQGIALKQHRNLLVARKPSNNTHL